MVLVIFAQAAIAAEPREAAFHDPSKTRNLECPLSSFDNL